LEQQKKSILNKYKELIALRNKEKALQYGKYDKLEYSDNQISYTRSFDGDTITTIINFGTEKKMKLPAGAKILMGNTKLRTNSFIIYKN
jgi:trehalose-6-phosphate hydrolase